MSEFLQCGIHESFVLTEQNIVNYWLMIKKLDGRTPEISPPVMSRQIKRNAAQEEAVKHITLLFDSPRLSYLFLAQ